MASSERLLVSDIFKYGLDAIIESRWCGGVRYVVLSFPYRAVLEASSNKDLSLTSSQDDRCDRTWTPRPRCEHGAAQSTIKESPPHARLYCAKALGFGYTSQPAVFQACIDET